MINESDFIEVEYTGLLTDDNIIFDTTDEKVAKEKGIHNPNMVYGPLVVCVGQNQVVKGLDSDFKGKEVGKEYEIKLNAEDAFGKKDAKLLKIVPTNVFRKQNINPMVGLQVNIDGMLGTIKTVTGGRTIVDFNHPLSGRAITYQYKINKKIEETVEKIRHYLVLALNCKSEGFTITNKDDQFEITLKKGVKLDDKAKTVLGEKLKSVIPKIKELSFKEE